jgi:UPF0755 protein
VKFDRDTARGFAGVLAAFLIIALIHFVKPGVSSAPDFPCTHSSSETAAIDIRAGESGSEIAEDLVNHGVTASYSAFFRVAVGDPRSGGIAPGVHKIEKQICARDALDQLLDSSRIGNLLAVNEGVWNSEIKAKLAAIGYSKSAIETGFRALSRPTGFNSLEGLLFPAQYSFESSTSVAQVLTQMMDRGLLEMKQAGLFETGGKFTPAQLLIIASLIQAEGDQKDFAKISQVVRNRLKIGMPLQFDSTIHYIKGSRGSVFLSTQSTYLNSPFNTYRHYGLPPAPINNPGGKALYAATHPESGAWLYFITVSPGDTRFTDSITEFNNWKILYKKNLKAGAFRSNS